jgi:hypothetical protein
VGQFSTALLRDSMRAYGCRQEAVAASGFYNLRNTWLRKVHLLTHMCLKVELPLAGVRNCTLARALGPLRACARMPRAASAAPAGCVLRGAAARATACILGCVLIRRLGAGGRSHAPRPAARPARLQRASASRSGAASNLRPFCATFTRLTPR